MLQITSDKANIGTTACVIYNSTNSDFPHEKTGITPDEWMVFIHHSEPEHIKTKWSKWSNYNETADENGSFWKYDPSFRIQVIS